MSLYNFLLDFKPQINLEYFDLIGGEEALTKEIMSSVTFAKVDHVSFRYIICESFSSSCVCFLHSIDGASATEFDHPAA